MSVNTIKQEQLGAQELAEFKKRVANWIELDNKIRQYETVIKKLKTNKEEYCEGILSFMEEHEITDLNTPNGKLKYAVSYNRPPVTKTMIKTKVRDYFTEIGLSDSETRTTEFITELYKNREKKRNVQLKRIMPKEDNSGFSQVSQGLKNL
jgi:hypothetical protein